MRERRNVMFKVRLFLVAILLLVPVFSWAQSSTSPASSTLSPTNGLLSPAELDSLVAPIALYPDNLLAEILMASTYPLEVVQAARWVEDNKKLKGDELKIAVDNQPWDQGVKALIAIPPV